MLALDELRLLVLVDNETDGLSSVDVGVPRISGLVLHDDSCLVAAIPRTRARRRIHLELLPATRRSRGLMALPL